MIIFVVPKNKVMRAIGRNNINLERLSKALYKRVRIVAEPAEKDQENITLFIKTIVAPVEFSEVSIENLELTITAGGRENKARLIGRQRIRQKELQEILEQYFGRIAAKFAPVISKHRAPGMRLHRLESLATAFCSSGVKGRSMAWNS